MTSGTLLWDGSSDAGTRYQFALGADIEVLDNRARVSRAALAEGPPQQIVIGPDVPLDEACSFAEAVRVERPESGVILLRHRLDVTALAEALRSGVREVVPADDHAALGEALRRSRELTGRLSEHQGAGTREGRILTVFSAKGGVGKTTLSTNLAAHLALCGLKTLLVDLDMAFGDVGISLQLAPRSSVGDLVAMSGQLDDQGVAQLVTRHAPSGLDVICAPTDPGEADRIPVASIAELLKVARRTYDYVVVDTPPAFTEAVLAACDTSDLLVLIATLDIPAVKNLKIALETLDLIGSPRENRLIVLNRSDAKVGLTAEDVVTALRAPIAVSIPSSSAVPASINRGVAIVVDEPRHPVSAAVRELADIHVRPRFGAVSPTARRRGLFRSRR